MPKTKSQTCQTNGNHLLYSCLSKGISSYWKWCWKPGLIAIIECIFYDSRKAFNYFDKNVWAKQTNINNTCSFKFPFQCITFKDKFLCLIHILLDICEHAHGMNCYLNLMRWPKANLLVINNNSFNFCYLERAQNVYCLRFTFCINVYYHLCPTCSLCLR